MLATSALIVETFMVFTLMDEMVAKLKTGL
jgi:hypothetical protein